ncbi:replication-associated recombination protein A [Clostridium botulinum]|uniref:Replication-associated recombination protein A n=1 Tax=Clostridium botulinum C/D str. DC5 TaxID=1443128 RepID=A0A0A0IKY6_CLOBO|nr:replication-associated recombination protein A [Clostridium botulinum]KEI01515.1 ATPase AAA [Clostridium botulinum C/D str. BKT75002]KEI07849.1 ATPase AAA [Clostridium botulinum C/D str. BKT2873]KGM94863.1 ATPase AAA [Clostridium botulinum D str. CCUG 7971]KGN01254.1 ATPase AAA [Clostridium botulinum C/D str. DC5]KOC49549.1 AAA family ATPase [Clostridium botulinum]
MDLFDLALKKSTTNKPLAERMRPKNLNEFFGQQHIIGKGKLLRRLIETDNLTSIILYGPPGVGKTTLAHIISLETKSEFVKLNATSAGVKEIREYIKKAEEVLKFYGKRTIFFIDEIHSLKKGSQQDALLEAIEKGIVILIGATTENPYFEINRALLSRSKIFQLESLKENEIVEVLQMALKDSTRGYGNLKINIDEEVLKIVAQLSGGDARGSLNTLELAILSTPRNSDGSIAINKEIIKECIQKPMVNYDSTGDNHYDIVSAFIKSIRGSNPDAALYWFGRMVVGGEDPRFIVRRLIVHASEDIGMKDPNAMNIAHAAWNALETVGMPEARIPIAEAIIYLATAPKSNAVLVAVDKAIEDAKNNQYRVPSHLRDTHYKGSNELGSVGYKYPHDYPGNYVKQQYFPEEMNEKKYYKEK